MTAVILWWPDSFAKERVGPFVLDRKHRAAIANIVCIAESPGNVSDAVAWVAANTGGGESSTRSANQGAARARVVDVAEELRLNKPLGLVVPVVIPRDAASPSGGSTLSRQKEQGEGIHGLVSPPESALQAADAVLAFFGRGLPAIELRTASAWAKSVCRRCDCLFYGIDLRCVVASGTSTVERIVGWHDGDFDFARARFHAPPFPPFFRFACLVAARSCSPSN